MTVGRTTTETRRVRVIRSVEGGSISVAILVKIQIRISDVNGDGGVSEVVRERIKPIDVKVCVCVYAGHSVHLADAGPYPLSPRSPTCPGPAGKTGATSSVDVDTVLGVNARTQSGPVPSEGGAHAQHIDAVRQRSSVLGSQSAGYCNFHGRGERSGPVEVEAQPNRAEQGAGAGGHETARHRAETTRGFGEGSH